MKNFIRTFIICFILCYVFLFFGGAIIFENFWAMLVLVAFIIAILAIAFIHQETKIEELEARIKIYRKSNRFDVIFNTFVIKKTLLNIPALSTASIITYTLEWKNNEKKYNELIKDK